MNKAERLAQMLAEARDEAARNARTLGADERRDEATLEQVRANIYEIFATVARTAVQQSPGDPMGFFRDRLETIPAAWHDALAAAQAHGSTARAEIERVKLRAAADIAAMLDTLNDTGEGAV